MSDEKVEITKFWPLSIHLFNLWHEVGDMHMTLPCVPKYDDCLEEKQLFELQFELLLFFMEDFLLEIVTHKLWLFRFEYLADILKSELLGQGRPLTVLVAADKNDSFPILLRLLMRSVGIITYCDSFFDGI